MASELIIKNKIDTDRTIKIAPFKKDIRKTHAHKHNNYFEIIYLSSGTGFHFIDLVKYPVAPPIIYFVRQEQVHYWELDTEPEGYVIIVKKKFIEKSLDSELKSLFTRTSAHSCLRLTNVQSIQRIFELLADEALLPPASIATNQERKFVIRVNNGRAEWVDVRQGMSTDKGIELFGNLHNGDTLLTRASDERKPGFTAYWTTGR